MANSKAERGRFSSRKKVEVVLRVLRREDRDLLFRQFGLMAARLYEWITRDYCMKSLIVCSLDAVQ